MLAVNRDHRRRRYRRGSSNHQERPYGGVIATAARRHRDGRFRRRQRPHRRERGARDPPARLRGGDRLAQFRAAHAGGSARKVVLVDFWTYTCINWLPALGYVRAWWEKYADQGLVVVGVHTPEFPFERDVENIREAVKDMRVE
ncbi:MAG: hypothetical protein M3214_05860 [Actinomycetota bacterium]|nr:hypothetical protein [Actinomycetota bacterium]